MYNIRAISLEEGAEQILGTGTSVEVKGLHDRVSPHTTEWEVSLKYQKVLKR